MSQDLNRIHNADFSQGRAGPSRWVWSAGRGRVRWERGLQLQSRDGADADDPPQAGSGGITIIAEKHIARASWSQIVVCKPDQFYRIEATITCDLSVAGRPCTPGRPRAAGLSPRGAGELDGSNTPGRSRRRGKAALRQPAAQGDDATVANDAVADVMVADGTAGFVLSAQSMVDDRPFGDARVTPGLVRASTPVAVRTYWHVPEGVRRLRVSVGVVDAVGRACIHHVRFIPILEPDEESHIMAIPPPPHKLPAPRIARTVCVCSATASQRPLTHRLAGCFGASHVRTALPRQLRRAELKSDALILPDAQLPPSIRSIAGLLRLADDRIVVVSLPALSRLVGDALRLRRIEQDDDPIHAQVVYANYATRGFALHDTFPYAWPGRTAASFVQNQFRKTPEMRSFCEKHGFLTLLTSMCDQDATSDRPICLYKETPGGGLFALDIEPVEADSSTMGETTLALYLLLAVLGQPQNGLGQYVSPVRTQPELKRSIRDMAERFEPFVVHDADVPVEEVTGQLVTVGGEDLGYGLSMRRKPVILIRSGLTPGDAESVYGAFLWVKQFLRMVPHVCPYAQTLASRFRLAWIPSVAPWCACDGWRRSDGGTEARRDEGTNERTLGAPTSGGDGPPDVYAALIDIVSRPIHRARVVLPSDRGEYQRYARWLGELSAAFPAGRYFTFSAPDNEGFADRDRFAWRHVESQLSVVVDSDSFGDDVYREVMETGGDVVRIEIPGSHADFAAHSIQRGDLAATLLEHVIGLQFGLIAVNRQPVRVKLAAIPPIGPGETLIIDRQDPMLRIGATQAV